MRGLSFLPALIACLLIGCASDQPARTTAWLQRFRPFQGSADVIVMDVALIETPAGDRYLNDGLWALADEQGIPLERKGLLRQNGLRVGQISASPPPELLALLTSERSCPNPRRLQVRSGKQTPPLTLGSGQERCEFALRQGDQPQKIEFEQAQCSFVVTARLEGGNTRLQFTPQISHTVQSGQPWKPSADRSGWTLQTQQPTEAYTALGWEVTLAPNEYVVVGTRFDRQDTLGYRMFVRSDEPAPVQRLLVIRTAPASGNAGPSMLGGEEESVSRVPPLALQANWSSVRGVMP